MKNILLSLSIIFIGIAIPSCIHNYEPVISTISAAPNPVSKGGTVNLICSASDDDNSSILNEVEKMHLDLYLMTKCKHYAVIPSAFNWWGTWLSKNDDKIVVRPRSNYFKSLNVKNKDYWPEDWISL